ncbi:MAG: aromatic amino acid transport family protein [Syntrophales bacterium]
MSGKASTIQILSIGFLIVGNLIGAGVLALPINTVLSGFLPPLAISILYPDLFLKAIDIAGGFGIVTLFGILPSIIALKKARNGRERVLGVMMLLLFGVFFLFETAQELGFLKIDPSAEYWNVK